MTRLGIVIAVCFAVLTVSFSTFANCLTPTPLKGATECVTTIKFRINELPPAFSDFVAPLLKAADALDNASQEFDANPQDLQQVHDDLVDASETIDGLNDPLFPFIDSILTDLKNDIGALSTDTPSLPLPDRVKNQILRTLDSLNSITDRAKTNLTKLQNDLLRSGNGVLDAIDAALTALSLDEEDDARAALALAIKKLDVVINDANRILRKIVSTMYKGVARLGKVLNIAKNKVGLASSPLTSIAKSLEAKAVSLNGSNVFYKLANGLYLVPMTKDGRSILTKLIVLK